MKVALFGGSFNPPHVGHLLVASYIAATADVDQVWLMPAYRHPFGKELAPFHHRIEMCSQLAKLFRRDVIATSIEAEVKGEGWTIDTLRHLQKRFPSYAFRLVIGTDILEEKDEWRDFEAIEALAPPLIVARGGHPHPAVEGYPEMPQVSSTEVRRRLAAGEDVSHLVPRPVLEYATALGLYTGAEGR